jgi:hypothetical protein
MHIPAACLSAIAACLWYCDAWVCKVRTVCSVRVLQSPNRLSSPQRIRQCWFHATEQLGLLAADYVNTPYGNTTGRLCLLAVEGYQTVQEQMQVEHMHVDPSVSNEDSLCSFPTIAEEDGDPYKVFQVGRLAPSVWLPSTGCQAFKVGLLHTEGSSNSSRRCCTIGSHVGAVTVAARLFQDHRVVCWSWQSRLNHAAC